MHIDDAAATLSCWPQSDGLVAAQARGFGNRQAHLRPMSPERAALTQIAPASSLIERRHLAILAVDVAGYTRLVESDELGAALSLRRLRLTVIEPGASAHNGRVVDYAGDGALIAFARESDAVACAVAVQSSLAAAEDAKPTHRRLRLRMGVTADKVLVIDGDVYGLAVNIAARLLALAAPGEVYLSGQILDRLPAATRVCCEPLGRRRLRNLTRRVSIYRLQTIAAVGTGHSGGIGAGEGIRTLDSNLGKFEAHVRLGS
jgi:class 3 adenylate cyclase